MSEPTSVEARGMTFRVGDCFMATVSSDSGLVTRLFRRIASIVPSTRPAVLAYDPSYLDKGGRWNLDLHSSIWTTEPIACASCPNTFECLAHGVIQDAPA